MPVGALDGRVAVPGYDRSAVATGLMHFGVGGFHRAHQALFTDDVLHSDPQWGICGVGLLPADARMRDVTAAQDRDTMRRFLRLDESSREDTSSTTSKS